MYNDTLYGNIVTLFAHSMGAPTSLYFLNTDNRTVTQQWKDHYNIYLYMHAYSLLLCLVPGQVH